MMMWEISISVYIFACYLALRTARSFWDVN